MLTGQRLAALCALGCGVVLWALHDPTPAGNLRRMRHELEQKAASDAIRVEPFEVLDLMYNPAARLKILDLRDENEFNLFHIASSRRASLEALGRGELQDLSRQETVVLVSNGEGRSVEGWMLLATTGHERLYIMKGGIHAWLETFGGSARLTQGPPGCPLDECRRYSFDAALGDRHPQSDPGPKALEKRTFVRKVRIEGPRKRVSGSCG